MQWTAALDGREILAAVGPQTGVRCRGLGGKQPDEIATFGAQIPWSTLTRLVSVQYRTDTAIAEPVEVDAGPMDVSCRLVEQIGLGDEHGIRT
jgi:hypothetical protein